MAGIWSWCADPGSNILSRYAPALGGGTHLRLAEFLLPERRLSKDYEGLPDYLHRHDRTHATPLGPGSNFLDTLLEKTKHNECGISKAGQFTLSG